MIKTPRTSLVVLLAALVAVAARAATPAREELEIDEDTRYVLDPRASPSAKITAMQRLADRGRAAGRAAPALLQQSYRGSKLVRDAALGTLHRVAGAEETMRLVTAFPPDVTAADVLARDLPAAAPEWKSAEMIRSLLAVDDPDARRRAVAVAAELVRSDPRRVSASPDEVESALAAGLYDFDRAAPSARANLVDLVEQLGPTRATCVHLLLRIRADDGPKADPDVRARAGRLLAVAFDPRTRTPDAFAGLAAALADPDPKVVRAAEIIVPKDALELLRPAVADAVAARAERGAVEAVGLLNRYDVDAAAFAAAVHRRVAAATGDAQRLNLVRALQLAGAAPAVVDSPGLRRHVIGFLGRPAELAGAARRAAVAAADPRVLRVTDEERATADALADALADAAARLLTDPRVRRSPSGTILEAIDQGQSLPASLIRTFQPDRRPLAVLLTSRLLKGTPAVRIGACRAIAAVGLPGDEAGVAATAEARAALDACLRSSDAVLRAAAAEAIDTPAARGLARMPELLRDLHADAPTTRQLAARQIQSLALEPPEITALLVSATDAGDLATREGLRLALEQSFLTARPPGEILTTLADAANPDLASRAYARAALRKLGAGRP